jgi:hypothetical protein
MFTSEFTHTKTEPLHFSAETELSRKKAEKELEISPTTCWRYLTCLQKAQPKGFDYKPYNQYLSRGTLEALYQFKQLLEKYQYVGATARIKQHMEDFYVIQESSRR